MFKRLSISVAAIAAFAALSASGLALAQTPASPTLRLRATIEKVEPGSITVRERSGEVITLVRPDNMDVSEVYPITLADIKPGSYIGTGAMPQPDGTQLALEVLVFPESARGGGEGHRPWDLQPESTMTNATVDGVMDAPSNVPGGQKLTLKYKGGQQVVIVPAGTPVVSFRPGKAEEKALIVPGAKTVITAQEKDGKPTALRVLVGRDGFAPPM